MHQFFLNEPLSDDALKAPLVLSRKEYQHLFVLRLREGEQFLFADGCGREHLFEVIATDKNTITAKCLETRASENELSCQLVLLQGLPKREKLEFIIQKAVELGAHDIVPVMMARSNASAASFLKCTACSPLPVPSTPSAMPTSNSSPTRTKQAAAP